MRNMRRSLKLLLFSAVLVLAGCFATERIVWSPDGKRAAVLAEDGLYLCDPAGKLSGPFLSNVAAVAWFADSQRLAIAQNVTFTNWSTLAAALPADTRDALRREAAELLKKFQTDGAGDYLKGEAEPTKHPKSAALLLCLRDEQGEAVRNALKADASKLQQLETVLCTLMVARVSEDHVEPGPVLARDFGMIWNIRIAPGGAAIAGTFIPGDIEKAPPRLVVLGSGGPEPMRNVDDAVALYPDWSPDGKSLVYIRAANTNSSEDVVLASLTRRRVVNERGQIEVAKEREDLAGLVFNNEARVRCLRDGRILFASEEWRLPATTADLPQRQQLFALDPERQATLTPLVPLSTRETLPQGLSYFEVSPDEKRVAFAADKSVVAVFTLADGKVDVVQEDKGSDLKMLPTWRSATELCYVAVHAVGTNETRSEIALWQKGKTNVLSRDWPENVRKGLLE